MMRILSVLAGLATLACAWLLPLAQVLPGAFTTHMTVHVAVVAAAAPLIALGLAGSRFDPVPHAPSLFAAIPASVVELIVVWAWHAPALHHAARDDAFAFVVEQGSFLATGLAVWLSSFGGAPHERPTRAATGLFALLLTSMHMTLLGALLALPPRPLFAHAAGSHDMLSPLDDQHLGGAIMLVAGGVVYLAGGLRLGVELLQQRRLQPLRRHTRRRAGQVARSGR